VPILFDFVGYFGKLLRQICRVWSFSWEIICLKKIENFIWNFWEEIFNQIFSLFSLFEGLKKIRFNWIIIKVLLMFNKLPPLLKLNCARLFEGNAQFFWKDIRKSLKFWRKIGKPWSKQNFHSRVLWSYIPRRMNWGTFQLFDEKRHLWNKNNNEIIIDITTIKIFF